MAQPSESALHVAITIDDLPVHGPSAGMTRAAIAERTLAALRRHTVPEAYGFVNGIWLEQQPDLESVLRAWVADGHPIGNHTYSHVDLNEVTPEAFARDVARNEPVLDAIAPGSAHTYFRYPYLSEGDTLPTRRAVRALLADASYRVAHVTIDFKDWAWNEPYARALAKQDEAALWWLRTSFLDAAREYLRFADVLGRQLAGRRIAHVLLLHLGAFDAVMLDDLLSAYEAEGVQFVTLDAALADPIYRDDPDIALRVGESWLHQVALARGMTLPPLVEAPRARLAALCRHESTKGTKITRL